jgi:hypothetical protein
MGGACTSRLTWQSWRVSLIGFMTWCTSTSSLALKLYQDCSLRGVSCCMRHDVDNLKSRLALAQDGGGGAPLALIWASSSNFDVSTDFHPFLFHGWPLAVAIVKFSCHTFLESLQYTLDDYMRAKLGTPAGSPVNALQRLLVGKWSTSVLVCSQRPLPPAAS